MFDNLTSINFSLVSVRQARCRNATGAHGVCCRVKKKTKLRLNSSRFRVTVSLWVCAVSETWLLVQMEAIVHTKTLRKDFHPYKYPV